MTHASLSVSWCVCVCVCVRECDLYTPGTYIASTFTVHFISADMNEPGDTIHFSSFQKDVCAHDIVLGELE